MKKILIQVLITLMILPSIAFADNIGVTVTIPEYDVSVNGEVIDTTHSQYPVITYKDITYFPMTFDYLNGIGLKLYFDSATGLTIAKNDTTNPYKKLNQHYLGARNVLGSEHTASIATYPIKVNGKDVDNTSEEYPVLLYNNITYFPMTWRFAVTEFGWKTNWDNENGFEILTFNTVVVENIELKEISSKVVDGRIEDDITHPFILDQQLVGNWQTIAFTRDVTSFKGFVEDYKMDCYLQEIEFYNNGETSGPWTWTKGLIIHAGDTTASRYFVTEINNIEYLFMEWKSGDYIFDHDEPAFYVFIEKTK